MVVVVVDEVVVDGAAVEPFPADATVVVVARTVVVGETEEPAGVGVVAPGVVPPAAAGGAVDVTTGVVVATGATVVVGAAVVGGTVVVVVVVVEVVVVVVVVEVVVVTPPPPVHGKGVAASNAAPFCAVTILPVPELSVTTEPASVIVSRSLLLATGVIGPAGQNGDVYSAVPFTKWKLLRYPPKYAPE